MIVIFSQMEKFGFSMKNNTLILPIERESRELVSRTIIRDYFKSNGFRVIMVNSRFFHVFFPFFRPGYVLENDLTFQSSKFLPNLYECGFKIFAHDEESFGHQNDDYYIKERICLSNFKYIEFFFSRAKSDRDSILKLNLNLKNKIQSAANYRFLNFNDKTIENHVISHKINKLRKKFSKIILVASKFSMVNRRDKLFFFFSIVKRRMNKFNWNKKHINDLKNYIYYNRELFEKVLLDYEELIKNNPTYFFVLRPHPGENLDKWLNISKKFNNTIIDFSESLLEWSKYCDLLIHNGSTSGLEAFLIGKQVIYYDPMRNNEDLIHKIPSITSCFIDNFTELNESISKDKVYDEFSYKNKLESLEHYLDLKTDFATILLSKVYLSSKPELNFIKRINYIFSKPFLIKLYYFFRYYYKHVWFVGLKGKRI